MNTAGIDVRGEILSFVDAVGVVDRLAYQRFGTITAIAPVEVSPTAPPPLTRAGVLADVAGVGAQAASGPPRLQGQFRGRYSSSGFVMRTAPVTPRTLPNAPRPVKSHACMEL